jgi:hypothetical protein
MSYIYEMDVARLRISYLLPEDLFCVEIRTHLENDEPYDGSKMVMEYAAVIRSEYSRDENGKIGECKTFKVIEGSSLQEVTEKVRRWVIKERNNKQSVVEKSPEDGTDSVISA